MVEYEEKINLDLKQEAEDILALTKTMTGYDKETVAKIRINQGYFRSLMIAKYDGKCCICRLDNKDLLVASHIKPWSKSTKSEKVSEFNGLLLCPNHDRLFDRGYISFGEDGEIKISSSLLKRDYKLLNINDNIKIKLSKEQKDFMKYHRENIFE